MKNSVFHIQLIKKITGNKTDDYMQKKLGKGIKCKLRDSLNCIQTDDKLSVWNDS